MKVVEVIPAWGHGNIFATNKSTFDVTKDKHVTKQGDCIIAVAAERSGVDLSDKFKDTLRKTGTKLTIVIQAGNEKEIVEAWGSPGLTFSHPTDLVVRKSSHICDRTLAIRASKAAKDLSRSLVAKLKDPRQRVNITLSFENTDHSDSE